MKTENHETIDEQQPKYKDPETIAQQSLKRIGIIFNRK
jgi:hypothetical protein